MTDDTPFLRTMLDTVHMPDLDILLSLRLSPKGAALEKIAAAASKGRPITIHLNELVTLNDPETQKWREHFLARNVEFVTRGTTCSGES